LQSTLRRMDTALRPHNGDDAFVRPGLGLVQRHLGARVAPDAVQAIAALAQNAAGQFGGYGDLESLWWFKVFLLENFVQNRLKRVQNL